MIFSAEAIANKLAHLDSIEAFPDLLQDVLASHLDRPFEVTPVRRYWEPGGGATLYSVSTPQRRYFLKVKHRSVFVESRLESERDFHHLPSLENEAQFLSRLGSPATPALVFYEERQHQCFLALEQLTPFENAVDALGLGALLRAWDDLESAARDLYARGIVHTDLHEGNLGFRDDSLVVCDFEEARFLEQDGPFAASLDVIGHNQYGDVGEFPSETGRGIPGRTCLARLREVFKPLIRERLREYLVGCRFDHSCPFNLDALQEEDPRIYQSIDLAGFSIEGQRPIQDTRKSVFKRLLHIEAQRRGGGLRHLDIGSNLGTFCFLAAQQAHVAASTGLEAHTPYIEAANALKFLSDADKVQFRHFICGVSSFDQIGYDGADLCTMLSVYHHISSRAVFLAELGRHRPGVLLAEFATQERYYPEHGGVDAEIAYVREQLGYRHAVHVMQSPDYLRPIILFTDDPEGADALTSATSTTGD